MKDALSLKRFIRKPYYHVPVCPCCGSSSTGRFIKEHRKATDDEWITRTSLKNGEIVCIVPILRDDETAFCLNCEYVWKARISLKWLSMEQIDYERERRGTEQIYYDIYTSEEEKEKDKKKKGFISKRIKKFIGK